MMKNKKRKVKRKLMMRNKEKSKSSKDSTKLPTSCMKTSFQDHSNTSWVLSVLTSETLKDLMKSEKRTKKRKNNKLRPRRNPRVEREKDLLLHREKNNDMLTIY